MQGHSYLRPLTIGDVTAENNLILGPMAGVTDMSFRVLCREQGAGLVCAEMVSAKAVVYRNKRTAALCVTSDSEHPVSLQLFGSDPGVMAEAAAIMNSEYSFDIMDINMGCPVHKIVSNGEGSALMKDPALIERIVRAVAETAGHPVTVKIRKGFSASDNNAAECARAAEAGGASMIAVHGRTREQFYSGKADWSVIREVKNAVSIPVAGSGDVRDGESFVSMMEQTGCDAVMIARAAEGNPWVFREIRGYLETGRTPERPGRDEMTGMLLRHAGMLIADKGEYIGIREMRKHTAWYTRGYTGAVKLRDKLSKIETMEELTESVKTFDSEGQ